MPKHLRNPCSASLFTILGCLFTFGFIRTRFADLCAMSYRIITSFYPFLCISGNSQCFRCLQRFQIWYVSEIFFQNLLDTSDDTPASVCGTLDWPKLCMLINTILKRIDVFASISVP